MNAVIDLLVTFGVIVAAIGLGFIWGQRTARASDRETASLIERMIEEARKDRVSRKDR